MRCCKRGQNITEYTVLIVLIVGAFIATSVYVKRGIQGRWKQATDDLGEQYDPRLMITDINTTLSQTTSTKITVSEGTVGGNRVLFTDRADFTDALQQKKGYTKVDAE